MKDPAQALRNLQPRIVAIGREIFERAEGGAPSLIRPDYWISRLMTWATGEPRRKLQLFRFVDVIPALHDDEAIVRHLAEYLIREDVPLPGPFGRMIRSAAGGAWYGSQLAAITRASVTQMARQFIAGENADEAMETVQALRAKGTAFTLDVLGEATTSDTQADWYAGKILELMRNLAPIAAEWPEVAAIDRDAGGPMPRFNVSIKLSSLEPRFDPIAPEYVTVAVLERLRPIFREARRLNAFVNIDMEQYAYKDLTLSIFRRLLEEPEFVDFPHAGIVLQAYLNGAADDLDALIAWVHRRGTPIAVRLVKGAYWDFETAHAIQHGWPIPVWTDKWRSDAQFESMARTLLDHRDIIRPALASHNVRSLAASLAYAEAIGAGKREFEIQMLFGMGDPLKTAVAGMGCTLRVYTPYGRLIPGMAYLIRRLLENTSNESFLRQTFVESESPEDLLADPSERRPPSMPLPEPLCVDPEEYDTMMPFAFEAITDFSREPARRAMAEALERVRGRFGETYPLIIDGRAVSTDNVIDSLNPSAFTEVVGRVCLADTGHLEQAVAAARRAFDERWSDVPGAQRAEKLRDVAEALRRRRFELAAWIMLEVGKPWREADADVAEAIDFCRYYGQQIRRLSEQPRRRDFPGEENLYTYQPRGVAAVIAPWNFPLAILAGMTTAALAAGNTVVMKPAEQSSVVAAKLMDAFIEAGLPPGVVNLLPGDGQTVGAALVEHPDVDIIAFTGSREVGVSIHEHGSKWRPGQRGLKRVIAEMGGKNAIIIDADADLDEAVVGVVTSAFGYCGQKCSACSRVIVHEAVIDAFVERLASTAESVVIGPADAPETLVGPAIDAGARDKTLSYIEIGRQEGRLVYTAQLGDLTDRGFFVPPTIFTDVAPDARIAREEIFGPVLAVLKAASFEEAIEIANVTDYALTGGVYSRSPEHVALARRAFHVGNLYINRGITGALVDRQPFGGFRMSGIGSKAGGPDYLLQFMEPKTITENTLRHGFAPESMGGDA